MDSPRALKDKISASSEGDEGGQPDLDAYWAQGVIPPERDHPDLPVLPPVIFGAALLAALVFEIFAGGNLFRFGAQLAIGVLLMSLGAGVLSWCFSLFVNEGTNIVPTKPTTALIDAGPYAYSRNPIYLAMCCVYLGLTVLFDIIWGFAFFPLVIVAVNFLVIAREEAYLEEKFGQKYRDYCARVRRWL